MTLEILTYCAGRGVVRKITDIKTMLCYQQEDSKASI